MKFAYGLFYNRATTIAPNVFGWENNYVNNNEFCTWYTLLGKGGERTRLKLMINPFESGDILIVSSPIYNSMTGRLRIR